MCTQQRSGDPQPCSPARWGLGVVGPGAAGAVLAAGAAAFAYPTAGHTSTIAR